LLHCGWVGYGTIMNCFLNTL